MTSSAQREPRPFLSMFAQASDLSARDSVGPRNPSAAADRGPSAELLPSAASSADADCSGRWSRHVEIEQAKGTLTALFGLDADSAFGVLTAQSQSRNIAVHVLAQHIVSTLRTHCDDSDRVQRAHRSLDRLFGDRSGLSTLGPVTHG